MDFLDVDNISVYYPVYRGLFRKVVDTVRAVREVSFRLGKGRVLSIIGESGSGKTTIGNAILGLYRATGGSIRMKGTDISSAQFRGLVQAVFQNPYSSLDPRMNVYSIVAEPLLAQDRKWKKVELRDKVFTMLESVGLDRSIVFRYPHEFSGGQRQRISIARALISGPELIILDEPVSSLDVSIRAQILNLLKELQQKFGLSFVYISHDLATVRFLSDDIIILYSGRVLESGNSEKIFGNPRSPYTRLLLRSARDILVESAGTAETKPSADDRAAANGCPFYQRCPARTGICGAEFPKTTKIEDDHYAWCHNI